MSSTLNMFKKERTPTRFDLSTKRRMLIERVQEAEYRTGAQTTAPKSSNAFHDIDQETKILIFSI